MKKTKALKRGDNFKISVDFLKINKISFKILLSNYTSEIICTEAPDFNYKEVQNYQTPTAFICNKMILSDLKNWSANEMPEVEKLHCRYFDCEPTALEHFRAKGSVYKCYNIDLKSAYLTILFNNYFIQKSTYDKIMKIDKQDRLVCVGMLASTKDVFYYINGEHTGMTTEKKETENYFYYCVLETFKIMSEIKQIIAESFLFSWVDSVYFFDFYGDKKIKIESYLKSINFAYTFKEIYNLKIEEKRDCYFIQYGQTENKNYFNIPIEKSTYKKDLLRALDII